jgi:hypothetical protein
MKNTACSSWCTPELGQLHSSQQRSTAHTTMAAVPPPQGDVARHWVSHIACKGVYGACKLNQVVGKGSNVQGVPRKKDRQWSMQPSPQS